MPIFVGHADIDIGGERIATARRAVLTRGLEILSAAATDVYGWENHVVGEEYWHLETSYLEAGGDGRQALVAAYYARAPVTVSVEFPGGSTQSGEAHVARITTGDTVGGLWTGSALLVGISDLRPV